MACERFREALTDVAAGAPAPAGLDAHLPSCAACRAELDALRRALALADAEMAGLLSAEPSGELAARIRASVAASPSWRFGWLWPATAVAATLLVALAAWVARVPSPPSRVAVDAGLPRPTAEAAERPVTRDMRLPGLEEPAIPAGRSSTGASGAPQEDRVIALRRQTVPRRAVTAKPEVLVPPGGQEALLRFVALVHRERLASPALGATGQASSELTELALIDVEPLEIVPLDLAETSGT